MTRHKTGTDPLESGLPLGLATRGDKELTNAATCNPGSADCPGPGRNDYRFENRRGNASLAADLFPSCGRSCSFTPHVRWPTTPNAGCPSLSAIADGFNGSASPPRPPRCRLCAFAGPVSPSSARTGSGWDGASPGARHIRLHFKLRLRGRAPQGEWESGLTAYNFREQDLAALVAGPRTPLTPSPSRIVARTAGDLPA